VKNEESPCGPPLTARYLVEQAGSPPSHFVRIGQRRPLLPSRRYILCSVP
jgi:hypothetical protein